MYTCLAALRRTAITRSTKRWATMLSATLTLLMLSASAALAQPTSEAGGEASLRAPRSVAGVQFLTAPSTATSLLLIGLLFCIFGLLFGLVIYMQLKNLPVHRSMREISELIYETCKTYLVTQGKFILILWAFIAVIIVLYFGVLRQYRTTRSVTRASSFFGFSLVGIAGSYGVAWFGIRVNTFANSRTAFASLRGKPYPDLRHSAEGRHEHRHDADQRRAADHAAAFCCSFPATTPARASSASPSANRWARRRCVSPAASSPRSPTSAPT